MPESWYLKLSYIVDDCGYVHSVPVVLSSNNIEYVDAFRQYHVDIIVIDLGRRH